MSDKLKLKEKIGYGLGDAASSMFWKLFSMYLLFFYTDVFGIPAAVAGTMFLVTRIWDAANDPIMGILADRTKSRWGKFRPYLLWLAIPFGVIGVLTFSTPSLGTTGKIVYAYVTYSLMMMVYTGINVPYAALLGVMTPHSKERTTLASFRMVFAFAGSFLVLAMFQPLFDTFGSTAVGKYANAPTVKNIVLDGDTVNAFIYENETIEINEANDSLLVLSSKIKTTSSAAFKLGILNPESQQMAWVTFPQKSDTLGLKRDGSWAEVKIKLKDILLPEKIMSAHLLKVFLVRNVHENIELKKLELNEINYKAGTQKAVIIVAIIAILFFILTFSWTKERVKPVVENKASVKTDFNDLLKNGPWFILLGAGVAALIFNSVRDGAAIYYFRYYIQNESATELNVFGLSLPIAFSTLYLVLGQAANIVGVVLAKPISDLLGKRRTFLFAMLMASVLSIIFYGFDHQHMLMIFTFQFMISVCAGIIFPLLWAMYADIADYSEWKTGRRATGLIFSSSSMSQKFGWTLGGALTGWLLGFYGFKADTVQSPETQNAIRLMLSVFPAIGAALSVVFIFAYKLSDEFMLKVNTELNHKRNEV